MHHLACTYPLRACVLLACCTRRPLTAQPINVVSVYDIDESGVASGQPVVLQLSRLLVMQPLEQDFLGLQSIDLPFHGSVQVSAADVSIMPYVGIVDLVGELDSSNVNIQPWPGKGFIVRGAVSTSGRRAA